MNSPYLSQRLEVLRRTQNADGGWSYYPGKQDSWLEPTAYAALALEGEPEAARAWAMVKAWQEASGGWRPAAKVSEVNWTTALGVLLAGVHSDAPAAKRGTEWLRKSARSGAWSWVAGNSAAEPTALAMIALARTNPTDRDTQALLRGGTAALLGAELRPETCGAVLVGLQGSKEGVALLGIAAEWAQASASPMTRAWIALGRRLNGEQSEDQESKPGSNLAIVALEALGAAGGNHGLLRAEVGVTGVQA